MKINKSKFPVEPPDLLARVMTIG